jgi:glycosyltransferase involved in cell wall biosynthesis
MIVMGAISPQTNVPEKISVIIPAFNESLMIGEVVSSTISALGEIGYPFEVIVVDDGSVDLTGEIAQEYGAKVIKLNRNLGKGAALKSGLDQAHGDIIVMMDADGIYNPKEIKNLINEITHGADVVIASRFLKNSRYSLHDYFFNSFLNLVIRILTGKRITDSQAGLKAVKRNVLNRINLKYSGSETETEFIVTSLKNGYRLAEIPVEISPRLFYVNKERWSVGLLRILLAILTVTRRERD